MADLHDLLERESERFHLPADEAERMFERGERRSRNRRLSAIAVGGVLFLVVVLLLRWATPADRSAPVPATPGSVAGTYEVRLRPGDPDAGVAHIAGRYEMRLAADGSLELTGPRQFDLGGGPMRFGVAGGLLTTDALVGSRCNGAATYRLDVGSGLLTLVPVEDGCRVRRVVLATHPWVAVIDGNVDVLEGEWTATFSCRRMVRAVRAAPIDAAREDFWLAATADGLGSTDATDPCRTITHPIQRTLRFSDGRLLIFDPPDLQEGFDGRYAIQGDVLTIRDGGSRNIRGRYRLRFRVDGGLVSFRLLGRGSTDPFFVGAWEAAPFVRSP
jgi:hypothetical protein